MNKEIFAESSVVEEELTRKPSIFSSLSARDNDDDSEEDVDISSDSIISSQLLRVNLPKEEIDKYTDFFYPKVASSFLPLVDHLTTLSARTSGFFALLRFCLSSARRLAMNDKQGQADIINIEAERILKSVTSGTFTETKENFLTIMGSGSNHVIVPSKKFDGGFDIQFIGSPVHASYSSSVPTLLAPYNEYGIKSIIPSGVENNADYKQEYFEAYATELSQKVIACGEEITKRLLGESGLAKASAKDRLVKTVPLSFNFDEFNQIFFNHTGILLQVDFMQNIDPAVVKKYNDFISASIIRTPKQELVREVANLVQRQKVKATQEGTAPAPISETSYEGMITREGIAVAQTISFGFAISLSKSIVSYITQAEPGEKPSMLSLHNWVSIWARRHLRAKGSRTQGGRIKRSAIPKYILPLSKAVKATEIRRENGFHMEKGKGDENNIFIAPNGSLSYGLPSKDREDILENLNNYETDMEAFLNFCFENGLPASTTSLPTETKVSKGTADVEDEFKALSNASIKYKGKILHYDWDYNLLITANATNSSSIVATDLVGAAKVDTLTLADYLGFNFADEGETEIRKSFADCISLMVNAPKEKGQTNSEVVGTSNNPVQFLVKGGFAQDLLTFYSYCATKGRVPVIEDLLAQAKQELGIETLRDDPFKQFGIYSGFLSLDLEVPDRQREPGKVGNFIATLLEQTLLHCAGGSYLKTMVAEENEGLNYSELLDALKEHPHYFDPAISPAVNFGRAYNYVGGKVFQLAMKALTKLKPKDLFSIEDPIDVDAITKIEKPNYSAIANRIMPLATLFSSYIPNGERIMEEAEAEAETNKPDESINEDDIRVSGAVEGAQMFPHQVKTHQSLRKRPAFAIMDIAPGGGKTSLGVTDIGSMVTELKELGEKQIKPIILCPDGLIKNWVDDMKIFTKNNWNMIPVNGKVLARWGYDKLEELIDKAPPNTIVVCGFNFLTAKREEIIMGTHRVRVSNNLEFMKRFGFDYICIDESHKLKNKNSLRHKTIKQLTTGSHVRFLRLATGTLINNRVDDITGQVSLYNGHIFREGEVSSHHVSDLQTSLSVNGDEIPIWEVDSPQRARQKLSRYASVVTLKKKDWAFMLPSPVETFIAVPMVPDPSVPGVTEDDVRLGEMHKQLYDAVLQESVEELQQLLEKAKARRSSVSDDDDDDDGEGDDDSVDLGLDSGDELSMLSSADLQPYLQRIERLVTNPMADPLAPDIFGVAGVKHYTSTKAKYIAKRIDLHFNATPKGNGSSFGKLLSWDKDTLFSEYDLVREGNTNYVARKLNKDVPEPTLLPESSRGVPPSRNTEVWKEEPEGKVIVFCRYTNSVNGVYDALPEHYKAMAVKFTGEEADKWANLDAFKNDPAVKILVANEMGIAEGHNLQLASRLIRVESPWAPGDLDQSSSRIFRPDPKAAKDMIKNGKPGELYREVIFLDWILCDNTMEVAKQARLIAKIFNKSRFDEAENRRYNEIHDAYDLDEIRMTLETLRSRASLVEFSEYTSAYAKLNHIQREEFHEMRVTQDFTMKNIEAQPEVEGSAKVQTPFISNQTPDDSQGLGLVSLRNILRTEGYEQFAEDPSKLIGQPVVTDLGNGRIAKVKIRYLKQIVTDADGKPSKTRSGLLKKDYVLDAMGNKVVDRDNPIVSFLVKSSDTQEVMPSFSDTGIVYLPTKLDLAKSKQLFHVKDLNTTKAEERRAEKEKLKLQRLKEEEAAKLERIAKKKEEEKLRAEAKRRKRLKREAEERRAAAEAGKKRKKNVETGKEINHGVRRITRRAEEVVKDTTPDTAFTITVHPAYFHGYLTLEVVADEDVADSLKKFKFKSSGPYVYCTANRYARFDKVLDYIESNFNISDQSAKRMAEIQDAFEEGGKEIYKMDLAPTSSMPFFFATRKKPVTDKKEIRPYPIIMPNELQIAVDLATSPAIKKHIGKTIPGAVTKWKLHEGHQLFFAKNKSELRAKLKELSDAGFVISNLDEAKAEVTNIKFRASTGK